MIRSTTICDNCGVEKREANHWFRAARVPGPRFVIIPWCLSMRDPAAVEVHLCGEACAIAKLSEFMAAAREEMRVVEPQAARVGELQEES